MNTQANNLLIYQGAHFGPVVLTVRDDAGAAMNVENYAPFAEARGLDGCTWGTINLAPTLSNGAAGQVTLEHSNGNTQNFPRGIYRWDLILQAPNGTRSGPYYQGRVVVSSLATQPV